MVKQALDAKRTFKAPIITKITKYKQKTLRKTPKRVIWYE